MEYVIIKTHAKRLGNSLYKRGEVFNGEDIEDVQYKLKKGLIKEHKAIIETKEEKVVKRRRTKKK